MFEDKTSLLNRFENKLELKHKFPFGYFTYYFIFYKYSMKNVTMLALGSITVLGLGILAVPSVFAAQNVGTVTGRDGDIKDKVAVQAKIQEINGSHVSFSDVETGTEYTGSFGPARESSQYTVGQELEVVGVETESENNRNNHNFQVMELDGEVIREAFEGKPTWAGSQEGNGSAHGGMNRGGSKGGSFVDANGDGVCDNSLE